MKKIYLILLLFSLFAFKVSNAQENFATPIVIGELVGTYNCGLPAYSNSQNTCSFANDVLGSSNDVVYQFTVSATSTVVLDMCTGTGYDSYLYLCDGSQAVINSNDDYCGGASYLTHTVAPGTYYVVVEGYWTNCGAYTLQVSASNTAPIPVVATLPDIIAEGSVTISTFPTANDCGTIITGTTTDPLTYSTPGTYIVTWTYDDGAGLTSTQTQNVTVLPSLINIGEIIGNYDCGVPYNNSQNTCLYANDQAGSSQDVLYQFTLSASATVTMHLCDYYSYDTYIHLADAGMTIIASNDDYCGVGSYISSTLAPGTYHIIVEGYSSQCGNYTLSVSAPNTPPVPDVATLPDVTGECSVTVTGTPTATDNCLGTVNGTTLEPTTYTTLGTYTVNWTYDDGHGGTATQTQTVIVNDLTAPVPDLATLPDVTGECSATLTAPTATDNCAGAVTATTLNPTTYNAQGTYLVTWTFADPTGNTSTQTQNVIIDDVTPPVPDVATLPELFYEGSAVVAVVPTATDNCDGSINGTTTDPLTLPGPGVYTINWTYTDLGGNSVSQAQTINVISSPVIIGELVGTYDCGNSYTSTMNTCNLNNDLLNGSNDLVYQFTLSADATVVMDMCNTDYDSYIHLCDAGMTVIASNDDYCGWYGASSYLTLSLAPGTYYMVCEGYSTGCGNYTVNVSIPNAGPVPDVATLPDVTGECVTVTTVPTATDACSGAFNGTTTDPLTYSTAGSYTINWTYDDGVGGTTTQTQNVIVSGDISAPVADVTTLPDILGDCSANVTVYPTATDICAGTITGTTTDPLSYSTAGTYTITWTYDDGNGHTSTQTQNVVIDDITGPVADVTTLPDVLGECDATVSAIPTATDACSGVTTGTTTDFLTYNTQGTHTITWTYTDGEGNTTTQTQNVVIDDVTAPVADVTTLADVTGECSLTVSAVPTATDNCIGAVNGTTLDLLTYSVPGTYTITWTYDDGNGNTSTQTQNVIVTDGTPPVADLTTLADVTGECSVTVDVYPTATDGCMGTITGTTTDPLTYTAQGTYTINWTYDDGNSNTSFQTQTVIVADVTAPEIACVDDMVINLNDGETFYTVVAEELNPASVDDNCIVDTYYNSVNSGTTLAGEELAIGTHVIIWTATDEAGNVDTCATTVVVNPYVGISDLGKSGYSVYPNPSEGTIFVSLENKNGIVIVRDALGRVVLEKQANSNLIELDLNNVESGAYTLEINNNGEKIHEKVIIK